MNPHNHLDDAGGLAAQAILGLIWPLLIQWAKDRPWLPWIEQHAGPINAAVSASLAILTTAGVSMDWSAAAGGGGTFTIAVPPVEALARGLAQIGLHELVWRKGLKPRQMPAPQEPPQS